MSIKGNWDRRISRRDFLAITGMSTTALALSGSGLSVLGKMAQAQSTGSEYTSNINPFTLGVASGDPLPNGVVLWTRLAPGEPGDKLGPLNGGGMPSSNVKVQWEVANRKNDDGSLSDIVQNGETDAEAGLAHSVHLPVTGLQAGTHYYYRFKAGTHFSTVGRTKTAPAPGPPPPGSPPPSVRFAVASCQSYQAGYWAPFLDIAQHDGSDPDKKPDLDCVVHVGDYIYEFARWTGYSGPWRLYRTAATTNLASYRNRHAEYKWAPYEPQEGNPGEDYGLQQAHAQHPWICTWDDHEMVNDYAGGDLTNSQKSRRNAAYQAYYEHMPIRHSRIKAALDWSSVQLYHDVAYGNLVRFCVLDTRQYRSKQPSNNSLDNTSRRFATAIGGKQHTILGRGDAQEAWLKGALSDSSRPATTWKVLANQVRMMGYDHAPGSAESYRMEEWDGYVATRNRISKHIYDRGIKNSVSVTGDLHCAFAADLKYHPTDPNRSYKRSDSKTIGTEFIGTSVCSDLGGWRDTYENSVGDGNNPHVKYLNTKEGGYLLCTVDPNALKAEYRRVVDPRDGDGRYSRSSALETIATATVANGVAGLPNQNSVSGAGSVSLSSEVTAEEQPRRKKPPQAEPPRGRDTR